MKKPDSRRLIRLVAAFSSRRIVVVGDLMLDRFIWGDVRRISPEATVPVVRVTRESVHLGGAGNVVANLAALGAKPIVAGWVGRDQPGRVIVRLLEELGADASGLFVTGEVQTIEKTRILAHSQQVVRLDREARSPSARLLGRLHRIVDSKLRGVHAVLVSDYGKGAVGRDLLDLLAARRRRGRFAYLIDPKQPNFDAYHGASLVKPNELEATAAAGLGIDDARSLGAVGTRLLERWQSEAVMISRGEHGLALFQRGLPAQTFPAVAREVFDVTGAGDTVMAVAALALASGGSLEEAAYLANVAAAIVVGKVGTATLERAELNAAIRGASGAVRRPGRRAR